MDIIKQGGGVGTIVPKGSIDCSGNPNYPAANAGDWYVVSVAGKIGGASGVDVDPGDFIICNVDGTPSGNQAAVGANWAVIAMSDAIEYTNATPVPTTVGRIAAGMTFNKASMDYMWDALLYLTNPSVSFVMNPAAGTREFGATSATVTITPTTVKGTNNIVSLALSSTDGYSYSYPAPNPAGGAEAIQTDSTLLSNTRSYTATVSAGGLQTGTSTQTITFQWKMYYGVSALSNIYTGADIMANIATQNADFATTKAKTYSFTPGVDNYVYFAYPAAFGAIVTSIFNSLPMTAWKYSTGAAYVDNVTPVPISLTNSSGGTANYYIIRSDNFYNSPAVWQIA